LLKIFFSGSSRHGSYNSLLAHVTYRIASSLGADAEYIELVDYELPLFNHDREAHSGIPDPAIVLKEKFIAADGFLMATPKYNSSYSLILKNAID
jgi:chromate reductase, NAD(P)H dehydrogenase (quinone)